MLPFLFPRRANFDFDGAIPRQRFVAGSQGGPTGGRRMLDLNP